MIKTPRELAIFVSLMFSLLIAIAAWGNTYMMWYDDDESEHKTNARRAAFKAAFMVFTVLIVIALALIILLPKEKFFQEG